MSHLRTKMMDKKIQKLGALAIVAIIIVSGLYVYFANSKKEEPKEEIIQEKEIDDRISPLTQQAIYFEIHRIRRKGVIIDQVMNDGLGTRIVNSLPIKNVYLKKALDSLMPGFGWDKTPIFNYILILDGTEKEGKIDYKAWDTGYINHDLYKILERWNKDATGYEGEKETVEVEFKFVEKDKKLLKTTSKIFESFKVTYDFRTGRWTGDDSFNDSDGYGHFNGTGFEMWFDLYQTDIDGDGIPYWTEVNVLETNPLIDDSKLDPDNDNITTAWEWKWGYDPFTHDNHTTLDPDNDGLQNTEEFFMQKWTANPYYPEIFIEVDHMEKAPFSILKFKSDRLDGWEHEFYEESQQMIMDRFNEHGITVHVDDGCMGGGGDVIPFGKNQYSTEDENYNSGAFEMENGLIAGLYNKYFTEEHRGIFRYLLVLHGGGECFNMNFKGTYDTMTVPMNKQFYKSMLSAVVGTPRMKAIGVAVSILHELGHTLGFGLLHHGGVDNTTENVLDDWGNYRSVMNYPIYSERLFDYSDGSHGENDKDDWESVDVGYFQRTSEELEGVGFDKHDYPFYR